MTKNLPATWSENENIRWKTPIPGLGWSSPVVEGQQIWPTTAVEEQGTLHAVRLDRNSGEIVHNIEVFRRKTWAASLRRTATPRPRPCSMAGTSTFDYGAHGTACSTCNGQIVWQQLLYDHRHGLGGLSSFTTNC